MFFVFLIVVNSKCLKSIVTEELDAQIAGQI